MGILEDITSGIIGSFLGLVGYFVVFWGLAVLVFSQGSTGGIIMGLVLLVIGYGLIKAGRER